jgi:hypothetical protein
MKAIAVGNSLTAIFFYFNAEAPISLRSDLLCLPSKSEFSINTMLCPQFQR